MSDLTAEKNREGNSLVVISQWGSNTEGVNGGNVKKMLSQIKAFERAGFDMRTVLKEPPASCCSCHALNRLCSKVKNIVPFCTNHAKVTYDEVGPADYYYIRFRGYDRNFKKLLRKIRAQNQNAKIVLEYPDYPYFTLRGKDIIGDSLVRFRDSYNRNRTLKYVDRIATMIPTESLDGKPCIRILNGIDVDALPQKKHHAVPGELHVLMVASLQPAHGVDLFIEGMKKYYEQEQDLKVFLHIVGGGDILDDLKDQAKELGDYVIFHGFMYGQDLTDMYDKCDIAIEILAPKRKNIVVSASLKSREYICRGMPFISACKLDISDLGFDNYCKVPDTELPIDISSIIEYYHAYEKCYDSNFADSRRFAEHYLSMDYAMKDVLSFFGKDTSKNTEEKS